MSSDYINVCRACLVNKESFQYYLFQNVTAEMYSFCTSLEVMCDDDLPKSLCQTCYKLLLKLSKFKQTCMNSHDYLICYKLETKVQGDSKTEILYAEHIQSNNVQNDNKTFNSNSDGDKLLTPLKTEPVLSDSNDDNFFESDLIHDETLKKAKKRLNKTRTKLKSIKLEKVKCKSTRKLFNYACDICNKKFAILERLEGHKLMHEGKNFSIFCEVCKKMFKTWNGLNRHRETEHTIVNLESLKCQICGKIFKSQQTLKAHQLTHSERIPSVCDICGKTFKSSVILKTHMETHKENRQRQYSCEQCEKKFYTNTALSTHVSRRHTDRRYICHLCCYPFSDKFNLRKHIMAHQGIKPYKCEICNQSYSSQSFLREHKRIHSGEKPYKCEMCSKCFISKKRLSDHHRTHTGEKPFKCSICTQAFTQRGTLKRHLRVHDKLIIGI